MLSREWHSQEDWEQDGNTHKEGRRWEKSTEEKLLVARPPTQSRTVHGRREQRMENLKHHSTSAYFFLHGLFRFPNVSTLLHSPSHPVFLSSTQTKMSVVPFLQHHRVSVAQDWCVKCLVAGDNHPLPLFPRDLRAITNSSLTPPGPELNVDIHGQLTTQKHRKEHLRSGSKHTNYGACQYQALKGEFKFNCCNNIKQGWVNWPYLQ